MIHLATKDGGTHMAAIICSVHRLVRQTPAKGALLVLALFFFRIVRTTVFLRTNTLKLVLVSFLQLSNVRSDSSCVDPFYPWLHLTSLDGRICLLFWHPLMIDT